mgnify:CR=1 FL=1
MQLATASGIASHEHAVLPANVGGRWQGVPVSIVQLQAKPDYVITLAKLKDPIGGLIEIVWNAIDAEAMLVDVFVETDDADAVSRIRVEDDGHGMPAASVRSYFEGLGGSWKAQAKVSPTPEIRRTLNGKNGRGRLRGFSLGASLRWYSVADSPDGAREASQVEARLDKPTDFDVTSELAPPGARVGTTFEARLGGEHVNRLTSDATQARLTAAFAPFLTGNPEVQVRLNGHALDPASAWTDSAVYRLPWPATDDSAAPAPAAVLITEAQASEDGGPPLLRVIEWPKDVGRKLALCDSRGVELGYVGAGIHKPGVPFTAYLLWDGLREHVDVIALAEWEDFELEPLIELARQALKDHLAKRDDERRQEQLRKWKDEQVYPYREPATSASQAAERQAFDEVATVIARRLPKTVDGRRATLRLVREVLAHDPDGLLTVLDEVFKLPKSEREDLKRLLSRTSLSSVIKASNDVVDRLDFLAALKLLVFDPAVSKKTRERSELHKIVERETWVFGDQYSLMASDRSLDTVLERHLAALKLASLDGSIAPPPKRKSKVGPVRRQDGRRGIVDLLLGQATRGSRGREHLVVEFKAPKVKIGQQEVGQLETYAEAVTADPQFVSADVRWNFIVISTELDAVVRKRATQPGQPHGCIGTWDNDVRLWALDWSEVIEDCERRLHYYRESLDHDPSIEHATEYLLRVHGEHMPAMLSTQAAVAPVPPPAL